MPENHDLKIDLKSLKAADLQQQIRSSKDPVRSKILQTALDHVGAQTAGFDFSLTFGLHGGKQQIHQ